MDDECSLAIKSFALLSLGSFPTTESSSGSSSNSISDLVTKVNLIEQKRNFPENLKPSEKQKEEVLRAKNAVIAQKIYSSVFKWVPENYYTLTLEQRAKLLGASSTFQLCKSMLMENKSYDASCAHDRNYARFYLVILQYETAINNKKLQSEIRALVPVKERLDFSKFDFRVASEEDNARLTDYSHNAVTPFGMKENIPIVLSKAITETKDMSPFIWMGGGHIHLKLGMAVSDFIKTADPLVLDVTDARP